jgi:ABC-type transporter Mla MlaB component
MSKNTGVKPDTHTINCSESMDISVVETLQAQLIEALESGQTVVLDAHQVERADTAALQVLSAFFQDAKTQAQKIEWKEPSDALCRSAALLDLSNVLNLEPILNIH